MIYTHHITGENESRPLGLLYLKNNTEIRLYHVTQNITRKKLKSNGLKTLKTSILASLPNQTFAALLTPSSRGMSAPEHLRLANFLSSPSEPNCRWRWQGDRSQTLSGRHCQIFI